MIFGETTEQTVDRWTTPHVWFTWRPVVLEDGRVAWWENVLRRRTRYSKTDCSRLWTYELPWEGWDQ